MYIPIVKANFFLVSILVSLFPCFKGSRLSKRSQGRIAKTCVECSLLYDCQLQVWYKRNMKQMQSAIDRCYRYVWSDRNGEPLR